MERIQNELNFRNYWNFCNTYEEWWNGFENLQLIVFKIMITDGNASASFIIAVNGERSLLEITWLFIQPQFKN